MVPARAVPAGAVVLLRRGSAALLSSAQADPAQVLRRRRARPRQTAAMQAGALGRRYGVAQTYRMMGRSERSLPEVLWMAGYAVVLRIVLLLYWPAPSPPAIICQWHLIDKHRLRPERMLLIPVAASTTVDLSRAVARGTTPRHRRWPVALQTGSPALLRSPGRAGTAAAPGAPRLRRPDAA